MSDALRRQCRLTAIAHRQPVHPPTGRHHVVTGGCGAVTVSPARRPMLCHSISLGLRLLLSIKFITTFYYFQTLLLLEYITYFIHIYI